MLCAAMFSKPEAAEGVIVGSCPQVMGSEHLYTRHKGKLRCSRMYVHLAQKAVATDINERDMNFPSYRER